MTAALNLSADEAFQLFVRGQHQDILEHTIEHPTYQIQQPMLPIIIASLSWLGRCDEAQTLFDMHRQNLSDSEQISSRFFLGLGHLRQSHYHQAHTHFLANMERLTDVAAKERFYIYQGAAIFLWFQQRHQKACSLAAKAHLEAIKANFFYGRTLALDLLGHSLIAVGKIAKGLKELERAHSYFVKLGDCAHAAACYLAISGYMAEFGINRTSSIDALRELLTETRLQNNNHSVSFLLLELARQFTLQGQLQQSEQTLQELSQIVQRTGHKRHEAYYHLRKAQNAYLKGQFDRCYRHLRQGRDALSLPYDRSYLLQSLGLELKLYRAESRPGLEDIQNRVTELTSATGSGIGSRILNRQCHRMSFELGNDLLGDQIDQLFSASVSTNEKIEIILTARLFSFLPHVLELDADEKVIFYNLHPHSLLLYDQGEVRWIPQTITQQMAEVLLQLSRGTTSKKSLIETIWGYQYHPMRHDQLIYGLVTRLRQNLGDYQDWVVTSEQGYQLAKGVGFRTYQLAGDSDERTPTEPGEQAVPEDLPPSVNHRQLKILQYLYKNESIDLQTCMNMFEDVSKVTLSRDLSGLTSSHLVQRIGRGRNTRYRRADLKQP